jgi:BlaI family transcriptional regulator, penicillinase repressor
MNQERVELTEAEWAVIKAVWETEPCTAPAIQERLFDQTRWTYSTARTMLDRMATKGLLKAEKRGKMTYYTSAVTPEQARKGELLYTLKNAFDGALEPMVQCLLDTREISREDLERLKQLIDTHEKAQHKKGKQI